MAELTTNIIHDNRLQHTFYSGLYLDFSAENLPKLFLPPFFSFVCFDRPRFHNVHALIDLSFDWFSAGEGVVSGSASE